MKVELKLHANCSEWDEEFHEDGWEIPLVVKEAIEEAKTQIGKEWDK